jgi:ribonuclease VapC
MAKPKAYVLDSWSMIAYLEDEPAGQKIADLIADAHENGISVMMSVINVGEVWYILAREVSESEADSSISEIRQLGIEFVDVNWTLTQEAARFKSKHKMSYADCFAAALAKENKASLVTGDREFNQVAEQVKVHWIN